MAHGPDALTTVAIFNPAGTTSVNVSGLLAGPLSVTVEASRARPPAATFVGCSVVVTALSSVATTVAATLTASGPRPAEATTSPGVSTSAPKMSMTFVSGVLPPVQKQLAPETPPIAKTSPADTIIGEAGVYVATPPAGLGTRLVVDGLYPIQPTLGRQGHQRDAVPAVAPSVSVCHCVTCPPAGSTQVPVGPALCA